MQIEDLSFRSILVKTGHVRLQKWPIFIAIFEEPRVELDMPQNWAFQKRLTKCFEKSNSPILLIKSQKDLHKYEQHKVCWESLPFRNWPLRILWNVRPHTLVCKIQCWFLRSWLRTNEMSTCQAIKHDDASLNWGYVVKMRCKHVWICSNC
jgi:hypothetical protein